MMSDELGRRLLAVNPPVDVRLSAFSPVTGMVLRPLYDGDAPFAASPQPAGRYLLLQPGGLAEGAGC